MFYTILSFFLLSLLTMMTITKSFAQSLPKVSPMDAYTLVQKGDAVIIDVREGDELDRGMITGANWLAFSAWESDRTEFDKQLANLSSDKEILVYCRSGRRSSLIGQYLKKKGYKVRDLGAFQDWQKSNLPSAPRDCQKMSC